MRIGVEVVVPRQRALSVQACSRRAKEGRREGTKRRLRDGCKAGGRPSRPTTSIFSPLSLCAALSAAPCRTGTACSARVCVPRASRRGPAPVVVQMLASAPTPGSSRLQPQDSAPKERLLFMAGSCFTLLLRRPLLVHCVSALALLRASPVSPRPVAQLLRDVRQLGVGLPQVLESLALHLAAAARLQAHSAHVTVPAEALARGLRLSYRGLRDRTA